MDSTLSHEAVTRFERIENHLGIGPPGTEEEDVDEETKPEETTETHDE